MDPGPKSSIQARQRVRCGVGSVTHSENPTHISPINGSPVEKGNEVAPVKAKDRKIS